MSLLWITFFKCIYCYATEVLDDSFYAVICLILKLNCERENEEIHSFRHKPKPAVDKVPKSRSSGHANLLTFQRMQHVLRPHVLCWQSCWSLQIWQLYFLIPQISDMLSSPRNILFTYSKSLKERLTCFLQLCLVSSKVCRESVLSCGQLFLLGCTYVC